MIHGCTPRIADVARGIWRIKASRARPRCRASLSSHCRSLGNEAIYSALGVTKPEVFHGHNRARIESSALYTAVFIDGFESACLYARSACAGSAIKGCCSSSSSSNGVLNESTRQRHREWSRALLYTPKGC